MSMGALARIHEHGRISMGAFAHLHGYIRMDAFACGVGWCTLQAHHGYIRQGRRLSLAKGLAGLHA